MPAPYHMDLRTRIIDAYESKTGSFADLAERFNVGVATVNRYVSRHRRTGSVVPEPHGGGRSALIGEGDVEKLAKLITEHSDLTIEELRRRWSSLTGTKLSRASMARALGRFGIVSKKKSFRASEQLTDRVQELRQKFAQDAAAVCRDKLVFLDEAGCNRAMAKRVAFAPRGLRAIAYKPVNHGSNITMVGAVRVTGPVVLRSMKGAMTTKRFEQWLSKDLGPRLKPGDVVVMDNLRAHHGAQVSSILATFKARVMYLPPYSPDLNPIEMVWSMVKRRLEKAAHRCVTTLRKCVAGIWSGFRHHDFSRLVTACGYA